MDKFKGLVLCTLIAILAVFLGNYVPILGAPILALFIGILINGKLKIQGDYSSGINFASKKVLRIAIILLGTGLSIGQVVNVGKYSLIVMSFTLVACFGGGYLLGKALKLDWKLSSMISAGTGICGGSAIASLSPVIEAEDTDVAYAMSATFIFDMFMIVAFPIMGNLFGMSDLGYGLWTGTAVNDTSSVVAAGYAFSQAAGEYATIVKLTRTISIIPVVVIFSFINQYLKIKKSSVGENLTFKDALRKIDFKAIFPWFILLFLVASIINSLGFISPSFGIVLGSISKFFMVMSLAAIGLKTDIKKMKKSGFAPMLHGFLISLLVVVVSFVVQLFLGQI